MTKVLVTQSHLGDIADAIRMKNGSADTYRPGDMAAAIANLPAGGGGATIMARDQWNALTTQQKKACGLMAIQDAAAGFKRGVLVYGGDFGYLINSDPAKVRCVATWDNFDPNGLSWGEGDAPVTMAAACAQYQSEEAVYFNARTGQNAIGLDLGSTTSDFTVYLVAKGLSYSNGDVIVAGSVYSWGVGGLIMAYHRSGTVWKTSVYGSDTDLIDTQGGYAAIAIRSASMKASWFAHGGAPRTNVSYSAHGTRFTFGSWGTTYSTDLAVKFVGFVAEAESDEAINGNLENLVEVVGGG